ncbi:MAG TPA: ElyC/SanA/YdcF family protein [Pseudomonadales bacterium]|nr:ElyC/SanA/YdcF family protein [Pseudomonadales bacterium]
MKSAIRELLRRIKTNRLRLAAAVAGGVLIIISWMAWADYRCHQAATGRVFHSVDAVPAREIGLVLGTSKETRHGKPNLHFNQRIEAAAALYHAGKVRHLLVSGDNHVATYDEPTDMRAALMAAGVPADAITCDYAGFRTLDSVVRAKEVFGLSQCMIISENFHCPRALWIAQQHGLDAIAFAAPDVGLKSWSLRARVREQFARAWCAMDLYLLHRQPHFSGPREPIMLSSIQP